ncbi:MAG: NAD(P)/FAD-dependent oxidoreductase, partial [Lachnospiraceae bacterium]|nr:NAD(P)/FAD-dependent oxidoreductase [Lachnospiraceae bacterium]
MKKVIIIGAGISGMTAGIYLQKAGYETEIYEKNPLPGGMCTGWKREGYFIDNCIHWLTGSRKGSDLHELWKEVGALDEDVELYQKDMFFSAELNGEKITFWRDKERTRKELLALSPEDAEEIHKLIDHVKLAESMQVPVKKPFDMMNPIEFMKMGMSMADMGKVMKEYGKMDINDLAQRFHHPLIRSAMIDYMPPGYQAYAFLVSYATVTGGNGDIPKGGSLKMALRMAKKYEGLGGKLYTGAEVSKVLVSGKRAEGIELANGERKNADYVICACDADFTFSQLLDASYMPKGLKKMYDERTAYPVSSGFQIAFGITGDSGRLHETGFFDCRPLDIATSTARRMSINAYDYEPAFAPEGCFVAQSNFVQTEKDFTYWMELSKDKEAYAQKKHELAQEALVRFLEQYPEFTG